MAGSFHKKCETVLNPQHGFTLLELVVVICVIGILAAVAVPKYYEMRENTADMTNEANAQSIKAAIILHYVDELMNSSNFTLSNAVADYNAAPADFFIDGKVPHTANGGNFTVTIQGEFINVNY